jgi:monofunctional biosynthetic peptidoglycan transglycosylase
MADGSSAELFRRGGTHIRKQRSSRRVRLRRLAAIAVGITFGAPVVAILGLRVVDPPITTVQVQRWIEHPDDQRRYDFVPIDRMSPNLIAAVIASEDARFLEHRGLDWIEIEKAMEERLDDGRMRGASTITQQLARNLFLTTNRSIVRKALEIPLALLVELLLPKHRILELYLNVVEWGPGIFGAEAASRYHYGVAAKQLSEDQAVRLAAILPSPRHRSPGAMDRSAQRIRARMSRSGR